MNQANSAPNKAWREIARATTYSRPDIHWIYVHAVPSTEGQHVKALLEHALQNLKTRMMKETDKCYWKASYDLATRTMQVG